MEIRNTKNIKFNIFSLNEWKESNNYIIHKFFKEKKKYLENLFENNELYKDLSFDYFQYDTTAISEEVRFGDLFFSDDDFNYKLTLILNIPDLIIGEEPKSDEEENQIETNLDNDIVIDSVEYTLNGTEIKTNETYEKITTIITEDELTDDFIITLISKWKTQNDL